jgi:hypothetical protein
LWHSVARPAQIGSDCAMVFPIGWKKSPDASDWFQFEQPNT